MPIRYFPYITRIVAALLLTTVISNSVAAEVIAIPGAGTQFTAHDSLAPVTDANPDSQQCISGLCWNPSAFPVSCHPASTLGGDLLVQFPSPLPSGNVTNDQVSMEGYLARNDQGQAIAAPAIVVVHESGSRMEVGRLFARSLRKQKIHAFLIHLPYYGERREGNRRPEDADLMHTMRQAIVDVRRAYDAVSALPFMGSQDISLHGTSLGGFVSATSAGLDACYSNVFLVLAGGHLADIIRNGQKDTAKVRQKLAEAGITGDAIDTLAHPIEPTRVAHRLDPSRTWLYSGTLDTVVPIKNAVALAQAAKLEASHHIRMRANHYSGLIYLPFLIKHISVRVHGIESTR